jgi:uncharacterized protein YdiU (UPF0061 family)
MDFSHTYISIGPEFFEPAVPTPVRNPHLLLWNEILAGELGIPATLGADRAARAAVFSGNQMPPSAKPAALAYAGHQFGNFVPRLGDGRAQLLGELLTSSGARVDIQLKGSGPSKFSRGGDGRCAIGPALREYIMSEAMAALGVPTTRCLAVVSTGETVWRQEALPGAVVTRVAASHIRVGTFEYFAARGDRAALEKLVTYVIGRHYPDLDPADPARATRLLSAVMERHIALVSEWMRVGFIHGVMNTDNTAISGETIDFGPCAMMNAYDQETVFSSIDAHGRYCFGNQPGIAQWNMAKFAESLLTMWPEDEKKSQADAFSDVIARFPDLFRRRWSAMMAAKLGFNDLQADDQPLVSELPRIMSEHRLDYTQTFYALTRSRLGGTAGLPEVLTPWLTEWESRLAGQGTPSPDVHALMQQNNPVVIARNHHMEEILAACTESGEPAAAEAFLKVLRSPYREIPETAGFQDAPTVEADRCYQTFCGT